MCKLTDTGLSCQTKVILCTYLQDPNVRLIRELKAEIQRLKAIITASNLVSLSLAMYILCIYIFVTLGTCMHEGYDNHFVYVCYQASCYMLYTFKNMVSL